jgi:microcystin-dependent protein
MADPFVAEIRIFPFTFAPKGWAFCNGQLLPLSQNTALFSLLGTFYGGDGKSTFALPNLQGSVPVAQGQGQGLSEYFLGQQGGSQTETVIQAEMPLHTHTMQASGDPGDNNVPAPTVSFAGGAGVAPYVNDNQGNNQPLAPNALPPAGGDQPHNNMMSFLTYNFNIAMQGVFPPRG